VPPVSRIDSSGEARVIYIICGILHHILQVDTSIAVIQFRGCFEYDRDCFIALRRLKRSFPHAFIPPIKNDAIITKEVFNPADVPCAVPSAIEIPWVLYPSHGGPRKPQLRSSRGPDHVSLPRKSSGHAARLYNPADLSPRSLYRVFTPSIPTSQSNPTSF